VSSIYNAGDGQLQDYFDWLNEGLLQPLVRIVHWNSEKSDEELYQVLEPIMKLAGPGLEPTIEIIPWLRQLGDTEPAAYL
jgi:hypothetical protein